MPALSQNCFYPIILLFALFQIKMNAIKIQFVNNNDDEENNTFNMTHILDNILLVNYDKFKIPETPTNVLVDINVRSMSRISESDMEYTFDCYFRQMWIDHRLSWLVGPDKLVLNIKVIEKIWTPHTYFINSKISHVILSYFILTYIYW